jgi:hypothetical protein
MMFEMTGTDGIKSAEEMHMHAMRFKWDRKDANKMTAEWTSFGNGKGGKPSVFVFKRS